MNTQKSSALAFKDFPVSVNLKLAALWTSFMLLYVYVDYLHLYMPGCLSDMQAGRVFEFAISPGFLMFAAGSMTIPTLMIFLSLALPAKANRLTNVIVAAVYIPYMLFNLVGVAWAHMYWAAAVEVVLLGLVIWFAWKWPRLEA